MSQETIAKENGIRLIRVNPDMQEDVAGPLLTDEILGSTVYYHRVKENRKFSAVENQLRILLIIDGEVHITAKDSSVYINNRGSYVSLMNVELEVVASKESHILEILWKLGTEGITFMNSTPPSLPLVQSYGDASQYREDFKTKKCISRSLVDHRILPDFAMGSNESYGPDRVEKHAHPLLDQFFFSFEDNDVELLIDDMVQPLEGNTLIHIPLGSDHGVNIPEGKKMHYVWIDFMVDPGAVAYLNEVHKKTGVMETFDENHQISTEK